MCIVIVLIEILIIFYLWSSRFVVVSEILVLYVNLNFYRFVDLILYFVDLKIYSFVDIY